MKKLSIPLFFLFSFLFFLTPLFSQPGKAKLNYQAVIRDPVTFEGLGNTSVDLRFQIFDAVVGGNIVYQEDFINKSTDKYGVVNLQIGEYGNIPLKSLNWGLVAYYINIQMRLPGQSVFMDISSNRTQLVSTTYAIFAARSDTASYAMASPQNIYMAGPGIQINGNQIVNAAPDQTVTISPGNGIIVNGAYPDFSIAQNNTGLIPPGSIVAYGGLTPPAGWLFCDGSLLPKTDPLYAGLYAALGTSFGGNATHFNLPDFRGRFLRGVSGTSGLDPDVTTRQAMNPGGNSGNAVGSVQEIATAMPYDDFSLSTDGNHSHSGTTTSNGSHNHDWSKTYATNEDGSGHTSILWDADIEGTKTITTTTDGSHTHNLNIGSSGSHSHSITGGDVETRPINAYVNYIIKL